MSEVSAMQFDAALVSTVLPLAPASPERLEAGIAVADVGCGRGHAVNVMADAYPSSIFVCLDISEEALDAAHREAVDRGLSNATFERREAARLDQRETYDLMTTFDAVHDEVDPRGWSLGSTGLSSQAGPGCASTSPNRAEGDLANSYYGCRKH